ncbi:hypothetical protein BDV32DRAFT_154484 [Aspergillus pseudonomiae]|uniref:Uncharacterized protein n=1 Tax=Aspergillus pseudonomiae TaxID=1506151 RepID=A0A5N7CZP2_9EURO|nr:uncharacterized protein BDV37DRAFT_297603 [Aspergillus pseudonomiae]KAB8255196.1 hypothetical protein BDV32DRAFT_154484 [Aspergillus pseudonomiae]KAE8399646.1 hypothetical protein BDV37DRAFT_297603 [Aspergillus pseudonomiae]
MVGESSRDYEALFRQAEERRKQAEERLQQAEERQRQAEARTQRTTFTELIRHCHNLLSRPLRAETPSRSTTGTIPLPIGKYCPTRLESWTECAAKQQEIFNSVCNYLQFTEEARARLFTPLIALEEDAKRLFEPICSEKGLEIYEKVAVEDYVRYIIVELCKIDGARDEFGLGDGIWFESHTNSLSPDERDDENAAEADQLSSIPRPRPDQFCIHRVDGNTNTLLTAVEYKPPHKLSQESLRTGLDGMDLWNDMVRTNKYPPDSTDFKAKRLACSAIVQEYHVMIQEGLEYSYVTTGLARVLLRVPYHDPSTLYYFLCDPDTELEGGIDQDIQEPKTSVARVLCLCLMAFRSTVRDQEWRNAARSRLRIWTTGFSDDHPQSFDSSKSTSTEHMSQQSSLGYQPSSPGEERTAEGRRVPIRSQPGCAPSNDQYHTESPDSSASDSNQATSRKRGFSQVASSPSAQRAPRQRGGGTTQDSPSRRRDTQFCTQRCLLGLQTGGILDDRCPNVILHRQGSDDRKHPISSENLVHMLKAQLDKNIDQCTPIGGCGAYGAPFKLTCATYGYTVIGKGTTSGLWKEVSSEAQIYQILRKAQGSAVPVFLGMIDLAKIYFLHGVGEIRHMLIMGWGGKSTATMELAPWLEQEIYRSKKEIKALGIRHGDLRPDNILWNEELGRALIIDFHRCSLKRRRPTSQLPRSGKRQLYRAEPQDVKRQRNFD